MICDKRCVDHSSKTIHARTRACGLTQSTVENAELKAHIYI